MEETAWLIDDGKLCLGLGCGQLCWVTYTDTCAIRFVSRTAAESLLGSLGTLGGGRRVITAVEHRWG